MIFTWWLFALMVLCFSGIVFLYYFIDKFENKNLVMILYVIFCIIPSCFMAYKHRRLEIKEFNRRSEIMKPCEIKAEEILKVCREKL